MVWACTAASGARLTNQILHRWLDDLTLADNKTVQFFSFMVINLNSLTSVVLTNDKTEGPK